MTEQQVQKKILDYLQTCGYTFKVISANRKGIPDIIACINGKFVAIEVKRPGKESNVTELQKYNLLKITENGGIAIVASSVDAVKKLIEKELS